MNIYLIHSHVASLKLPKLLLYFYLYFAPLEQPIYFIRVYYKRKEEIREIKMRTYR